MVCILVLANVITIFFFSFAERNEGVISFAHLAAEQLVLLSLEIPS